MDDVKPGDVLWVTQKRTCAECGKDFHPLHKRHKYCCARCGRKNYYRNNKAKEQGYYRDHKDYYKNYYKMRQMEDTY